MAQKWGAMVTEFIRFNLLFIIYDLLLGGKSFTSFPQEPLTELARTTRSSRQRFHE